MEAFGGKDLLVVPIRVGGTLTKGLVDTGASVVACGARRAEELGLTVTGTTRAFRGLSGDSYGRESNPVEFAMGRIMTRAPIMVFENDELPLLLSLELLGKLNIHLDCSSKTVYQAQLLNYVSVNTGEARSSILNAKGAGSTPSPGSTNP